METTVATIAKSSLKKKLLFALIAVAAAATLVAASIAGTVAYLTASSAVSNTFTIGNVTMSMFESPVNSEGQIPADYQLVNGKKTSDGNSYHLLNGTTYDKDPTIYVEANSDKSFLFVKIRNQIVDIEETENPDCPTIAQQMAANGWVVLGNTPSGIVYVYHGVTDGVVNENPTSVGGSGTMEVYDVFSTFTVKTHCDISLYGGAKVTLTAFAIQKSGFEATTDGAKLAWAQIVAAYPYEDGALQSNP